MDIALLKKHIQDYVKSLKEDDDKHSAELAERLERATFYRRWNKDRILSMSKEDLYEYLSRLWAMLIWGNKQYVVDKLISKNGLTAVREELAELVWGKAPIAERWDRFRKSIKGMGPAMMSEILCHVHSSDCMLWNRRAYVGFNYLGVKNLPRYDYQMTGKKYEELSSLAKKIAAELEKAHIKNPDLLTVDYFIWDELQVEENLSQIYKKHSTLKDKPEIERVDSETSDFIHNEVRDKLADIGRWLGFTSHIETKVAEGSKVDTVWEATIGNMGRVIYIFEVQTKGSSDSLILNLLKSLNNPAVQGVVAVSDTLQLEKIKKHAVNVWDLGKKLKYWDFKEVLQIHEALEAVNESINRLGLVPTGFLEKQD